MRATVLLAGALTAFVLLAAPTGARARTVHIRGTAYEFNNTGVQLAGAKVRVAEYRHRGATTRRDGTYDLAVPDHATVTPYITASGYHSIHLQTFRTDGENLARVNFQTPTEGVYRALAALLKVPLSPDGELRDCAIVSTFSTRNVRDLSFRRFRAYGAHGVAGATAFATPALPGPIYFNENVIPDTAQRSSSVDGGVIWTGVPAGVYRMRARHPSTRFASFLASCRPGRIVNANPPWGFHELGKGMHTTAWARWLVRGANVRLRRLRVAKLPRGAQVRMRCQGRACPFRSRRLRNRRIENLDLRAGQSLELLVTAHAYDGRLFRWRLRSARPQKRLVLCVPLGNTKPLRHC